MKYFIIAFGVFVVTYGMFQYGRIHDNDAARPMPTFIGYGCEGVGGDLWAMEIRDFPACKEIVRY